MPTWMQAGGWGLAGGAGLLVGAWIGFKVRLPLRAVAAIMAFGSGVLISALAFELMDEAFRRGGFGAAAAGFAGGAIVFTGASLALNRWGARHRKRSRGQPSEAEDAGSGLAIAAGALLDNVPEAIVLGLSLLGGSGVNFVTLLAIALSNVSEGLSSVAGMRHAGRSGRYIFLVWGSIAASAAPAAALGYVLFADAAPETSAGVGAFAAGAILAMIIDTMIPEAFHEAHDYAGLITAAGFLVSFALTKLPG